MNLNRVASFAAGLGADQAGPSGFLEMTEQVVRAGVPLMPGQFVLVRRDADQPADVRAFLACCERLGLQGRDEAERKDLIAAEVARLLKFGEDGPALRGAMHLVKEQVLAASLPEQLEGEQWAHYLARFGREPTASAKCCLSLDERFELLIGPERARREPGAQVCELIKTVESANNLAAYKALTRRQASPEFMFHPEKRPRLDERAHAAQKAPARRQASPESTSCSDESPSLDELGQASTGVSLARFEDRQLLYAHIGEPGFQIDQPVLPNGATLLHLAAEFGDLAVVEMLLASRARVDVRDAQEQTPLLLAAAHGHAEVVKKLLGGGANPMSRDRCRKTALHLAAVAPPECLDGALEVAKILVVFDVGVLLLDRTHVGTPIADCASSGQPRMLQFLFEAEEKLGRPSMSSGWLLASAADGGNAPCMRFMLDRYPSPPDFFEEALGAVVSSANIQCLEVLLEHHRTRYRFDEPTLRGALEEATEWERHCRGTDHHVGRAAFSEALAAELNKRR